MIAQFLFHYIYDRLFLLQIAITLVVYLAIRILQLIQYRRRRFLLFKLYDIPGPEPSLLNGNFSAHRKRFDGKLATFLVEQEMSDRYGKFYGIFIGDQPSIIVTDLDMLKKIFVEPNKSFSERTMLFLDVPLNKSILFARYPRWRAMRKSFSPLFSKYNMRGVSQTQFIEDSLKLMIDYLDHKVGEAHTANQKAIIDIIDLMKSTALHLISTMAIRLPNVEIKEGDKYVQSLDKFMSSTDNGVILFSVACPIVKPLVQFIATHFEHNAVLATVSRGLNKVVDEGIEKLRGHKTCPGEEQNLIDLMIRLHVEGKLTKEEVLANAEAILIAGYDTTSTTMTYIIWAIAKHPEVQARLREEVRAHGLESEYLTQVIKETMRLYPAVATFTTRLATETVEINGQMIPKGARVVYNFWLMSRSKDVWREPEKFDPERFRNGVEIHPCAFAPFGLGERVCLGYQLAWLELKMITCDLLLRYNMKLVAPQNLDLVTYAVSLTKPRESVKIEFEKLQ